MKLKLFYALIISASMLFVGCSESDMDEDVDTDINTEEPSTPEEVSPTGISLNETTITLSVNDTFTLTATLTPSDAEGTITWSSSDQTAATVSTKGVVMAMAAGTTNITATCGDLSAVCAVTVTEQTSDEGQEDPEEEVDADNIFQYAYGYGPEGSATWTYVDSADNDGVYELTNSSVQANDYDTQFCIVYGIDQDGDGVIDQGIEEGYTYTVSMMVKQVGDLAGLWPGISSDIPGYDASDYLGAPEPNAWYNFTDDWGENTFTMTTLGFENSNITGGNIISFSIGTSVTTLYVKDIKIYKAESSAE